MFPPTLLSCSSCFLYALQQNRAHSRLVNLSIKLSYNARSFPEHNLWTQAALNYNSKARTLCTTWCLTLALGQLENVSFFIQILCWAPWISQLQSTGPPSIFLRAQPCQVAKQQSTSLCTIWVTFSLGTPCSHVTKYTFTA